MTHEKGVKTETVTGASTIDFVIHLDQKDWIGLARGHYGKDSELTQVSKEVVRAADSGKVIFPMSVIHLDETVRNQDDDGRKRLAEFITKVSKGWSILPAQRIIDLEIESACLKNLGVRGYNLREYAIKKSWFHMFGSKGTIVDKDPLKPASQELKDYVFEKVSNVESLLLVMKWGADKTLLKERQDEDRFYVQEAERIRKLSFRTKDKKLRHKVDLAKYSFNVILPKIITFLLEIGVDPDVFATRVMTDEDSIIKFFQSIPTAFCAFELDYDRNMQAARKIQANDLNDIMSLSIALPYCDIVITERMWRSRIVDMKLHRLRPTKVLASVKDLRKILAQMA